MADFCKQCSIELFGKDYGNFVDIAEDMGVALVLCENCGRIFVDQTGERIQFVEMKTDSVPVYDDHGNLLTINHRAWGFAKVEPGDDKEEE